MNPKFLAPKDFYQHPRGNSLRAWMWAMLNQKSEYECRLTFFLDTGDSKLRQYNLRCGSWLSLQLSFCIPHLDFVGLLPKEIWNEYGKTYGLSNNDIESLIDPFPF